MTDLKRKAKVLTEGLNAIYGISCTEVKGALYAFPRIHLPEKAIKEAQVSKSDHRTNESKSHDKNVNKLSKPKHRESTQIEILKQK